jgi:putative membrane protein
MISLLLRIIVNAAAIFAAVQLLPGLHWNGTFLQLAGVALVFGVINGFLKPILSILTCPLQFLTLGLFGLVLNGLLLMLTAYLSQQLGFDFKVDGILWAIIGGIVIGLVSTALSLFLPGKKD